MSTIVTRFAPSPTGYLHIGGARTALFNWLYARANSGKFLLRIEDTDRARHDENAVTALLDGLRWLGLDWDDDVVSQFERSDRHRTVALEMLDQGTAYKCWLDGDDLAAEKQAAREENRRFESPWRDATSGFPDLPFAVRLKAPRDGETLVRDEVQGEVAFQAAALDDMILLRSDGSPTYMHAVVVDDHDMGITHVIRGDDHFINAARQQQLYKALEWDIPVWVHVPLIHGPDGKKLSKRHGALGIEAYADMGYLPAAMRNYLMKLGWSHGDDEIISMDQALEWFDLAGLNKAAARLDFDKLAHLNSEYIKQLSDEDFIARAMAFFPSDQSRDLTERLIRAAPFLKDRVQTLKQAPDIAQFLALKRPLEITGKAAKPLRKEGAREILNAVITRLSSLPDWSITALDQAIQALVDEKQVGFGQVGQPVRAALTAGYASPSLGEVFYILGREEALARLNDQASAKNYE
ncbi:MAG: glutamate--tRNA ligase [Parvularculaceae bacterium]